MSAEEDGWRRFLKLCLKAKGEGELDALLDTVLTPTERKEIAYRILILRELLKGEKTQREIAKELSVSIAYITRGSNALKRTEPALKRMLES
jgi:TrpR family trp operon transcriptional repressor